MTWTAATIGTGMLAAWPIPAVDALDRDALITAAMQDLADITGGVLPRVITWRVLPDVAQLDGWAHWPGDLLVATLHLKKDT